RQVDRAHRDWTEEQIGFLANVVRLHRGETLDFTLGADGAALKIRDIFGTEPVFKNVAGFCRSASLDEMTEQGWSLNPGRYVGVAEGESLDDEAFAERLAALTEEFGGLVRDARFLEDEITASVATLLK